MTRGDGYSANGGRRAERGATAVETVIMSVVLLLILGVMIDLGMTLYRNSLLTNATIQTLREFSVRLKTPSDGPLECEAMETEIRNWGKAYLAKLAGGVANSADFSETEIILNYDPSNPHDPSVLRVSAVWQTPCLLCLFLKDGKNLRSSSAGQIESVAFDCIDV